MADGVVVRVEGLRELQRAFRAADRDLLRDLRHELADAGGIVADEERAYLSRIGASPRSIGGIRPQVRMNQVAVQQRYGTVTGQRGDWGARIMSSLARSRAAKRTEIESRLELMLDRLSTRQGF